jgi:OmpA-OmpF porin, OOP family
MPDKRRRVPVDLEGRHDASILMRQLKRKIVMNVRNHKTLVALALACGSLGAFAATNTPTSVGAYAGASLGTTQFPDSVNGVSGDGSPVSGKLFGGYQFTPNFALEVGAANLGSVSSASGDLDGRAVFLDAVGSLPLSDRWSVLGRIGVAQVNANTSFGDDSGNGLKVGLGAQYSLSNKVAIRGEWERYQANVFGDKPNVDQYTLGLKVGF